MGLAISIFSSDFGPVYQGVNGRRFQIRFGKEEDFTYKYRCKMDLSETLNINLEKYFMNIQNCISKIFDSWV